MNSFIILSSTLFFSIHTMPMETDTSSDNEVPTMEKTIEAAKKEIQMEEQLQQYTL